MRRPRLGARRLVLLVLTPVVAFYFYLTLLIALALFRDGRLALRGMALGLVALVAVSAGLLIAELGFGRQAQALSTAYDAEVAAAPVDSDRPPWAADGRPNRDAADAAFAVVARHVETDPDDWRAWYELALAYGDARDTRRGRQAMRRAVELKGKQ